MSLRGYCPRCDAGVEATGAWPGRCAACGKALDAHPVPDIVAPGLKVLFVGINPGVRTARAGHHFANPQNTFWALLHEAGLTPRRFAAEQGHALLTLGMGITNAATRATPAAADLRQEDVARGRARLAALVEAHEPAWLAFVGKQAHRMATGRAHGGHGAQHHTFRGARCYVLPSTSPANAAVSREEKLRWFRALARVLG